VVSNVLKEHVTFIFKGPKAIINANAVLGNCGWMGKDGEQIGGGGQGRGGVQ
jgi:hypothetical protein